MLIDESAIPILKRENYYNLINGYKDIFLDVDSPVEKYKDGVTFWDVYNLFCLDRDIRFLFFKRILDIESTLKSVISYRASEEYIGDQEFYLKAKTYSSDPGKSKNVQKTIEVLSSLYGSNAETIRHYRENHGGVPFFVLVRNVTLGSLSYFYSLLESPKLKSRIAHDFRSMNYEQTGDNRRFGIKQVEQDLRVLTEFRNICAHGERFYCHVSKNINYAPAEPASVLYLIGVLSRYSEAEAFSDFIKEFASLLVSSIENNMIQPEQFFEFLSALGFILGPDLPNMETGQVE